MQLIKIVNIYKFLSGLELSKFDKEVRKVVRKNYIAVHKIVADFEETKKVIMDKCFEDVDEQIKQKVSALEQEFSKASESRKSEIEKELLSDEYKSYQEAKKECVGLIEEELKRDITEPEWAKVDEDAWMDSFANAQIKFNASLIDEIQFMVND